MFYRELDINGTVFLIAVNITGKGAPSTSTEALVGMLYMDEDDGSMYKCTAASDGVYTWERMLRTLQETGDSKKDTMSQKAITDALNLKITAPQTAKAGQVLKVVSVDENGLPTEWETGESLPTVTDSDNGKVLTVKDGVWSAAELPVYKGEVIE